MGNSPLTTTISVKDRDGRIIEQREVATYAGLLARAHEEGLKSIQTQLIQAPDDRNQQTAIVQATVETAKGTFSGIGDANPGNVNRKVAAHVLRMAETRAKARALRDAVNIGIVALEELGGEEADHHASAPPPAPAPAPAPMRPGNVRPLPRPGNPAPRPVPEAANREPVLPRGNTQPDNNAMTENQRRWLYRYLSDHGFEGNAATDALCRAADVQDIRQLTKATASAMIDSWKQDEGSGRAA